MRYAHGGGLTPKEQQKRERVRLQAAERFGRGGKTEDVARDLRVTARSVRRWRRVWEQGGAEALRSTGPASVERLSLAQWEGLERELKRGPLAHGFDDEFQGWTLKRVKLLIGRMFRVGYTIQGVWKLLRRHGWSAQVPVRRALERDEEAIEVWKTEVWPQVKRTAAHLGAHICFEDETGQGLRPPKGRTWAPRGSRPVVRVHGRNRGRVNIAGVVCYRVGYRSRFFFKLHIWHGRRGEPKAFSWRQYRDLIVMTHLQLGTPVVWCWDNLNVHLVKELVDFAEKHKDWLQIFQMPSYAPELNPTEGIWSLLKRHLADFAAADLTHLTRVIKRKLKKIQYGPHLIDGCLPPTGLIVNYDLTRSSGSTSST